MEVSSDEWAVERPVGKLKALLRTHIEVGYGRRAKNLPAETSYLCGPFESGPVACKIFMFSASEMAIKDGYNLRGSCILILRS